MKHTPGPWIQEAKQASTKKRNVYEHGESIKIIAQGKSMFSLATVDGPSNFESQEEMRANARLIALAPEMLQALKEIVAWAGKGNGIPEEQLASVRKVAEGVIYRLED